MTNNINLQYGTKQVTCKEPANYRILESGKDKNKVKWDKKIEDVFSNPVDSQTLTEIVKNEAPEKIVIIINDITRPVPYNIVLKPILDELLESGIKKEQIKLIIATGMHRPMTADEVAETLGEEIADNYHWLNHKCKEEMIYLGQLKNDIPLYVNPLAVEADLLCAVGVIAPHYMAGFSGGRKSLLPGVCGKETIESHHSLMRLPESRTANLERNQFHETMLEAAEIAGLRFISNVVVDSKNEVIDLVAGDYYKAWQKGVELCNRSSVIEVDELADAAVVSVGGFPKDINMYQAQKALENASYCVKKGGPILIVAECREGLGEEVFEKWLDEAETVEYLEKKIKKVFELGGHKAFAVARVAKEHPLYLYSSMDSELTAKTFMKKIDNLDSFIEEIVKEDDFVYILPHGANTVPNYKYVDNQ
ncbi:MAG: nickel-dependent lactate racemase [Halothermotrichaceae bacterium]